MAPLPNRTVPLAPCPVGLPHDSPGTYDRRNRAQTTPQVSDPANGSPYGTLSPRTTAATGPKRHWGVSDLANGSPGGMLRPCTTRPKRQPQPRVPRMDGFWVAFPLHLAPVVHNHPPCIGTIPNSPKMVADKLGHENRPSVPRTVPVSHQIPAVTTWGTGEQQWLTGSSPSFASWGSCAIDGEETVAESAKTGPKSHHVLRYHRMLASRATPLPSVTNSPDCGRCEQDGVGLAEAGRHNHATRL